MWVDKLLLHSPRSRAGQNISDAQKKGGSTGDHETFAWHTDRQRDRDMLHVPLSRLFNVPNSRLRVKSLRFCLVQEQPVLWTWRTGNSVPALGHVFSAPLLLWEQLLLWGGGGGGGGEKKIPNTPNWGERERGRERERERERNGLTLILLWNVYRERGSVNAMVS